MRMTEILKEVGRGKRGARDLNYEEALAAAELIFGQTASPAQIGAFFLAERVKMESLDELLAFVEVCRRYASRSNRPSGLDCAGPYDGRKASFIATFATAFVLASVGLPVTLHGTASLPPKWGMTLTDLLQEMGVREGVPMKEHSLHAYEQSGILFVPAETWCPPLGKLREIREDLGLRTILNTVEKLVDYSYSPYLVFGVFHNTVFDRSAQLLQRLNYRRALIVQGAEGSEDVYIDRPTRTYFVEQGVAKMQIVDPETYGLESDLPEMEWSPAEQLRVSEGVLNGEAHIAFVNQVVLNGALRLHLAGMAGSVEEGIYTCKSMLDNGAAWQAYSRWKEGILGGRLVPHTR